MRVQGAKIENVVFLGSETREYKDKLSVKARVLQGGEIISLTVPEEKWSVIDSIGTGQSCDIVCTFGWFYNKEESKVITYIRLEDITGIVQE